MPSKTPKQQRAMRAAASGNSTLGIPKSVGRDFVKADVAKAHNKPAPKGSQRKR